MTIVTINVAVMSFLLENIPENKTGITLASMRTFVMAAVPIGAVLGGLLVDAFGYVIPICIWLFFALLSVAVGIGTRRLTPPPVAETQSPQGSD